MAPQAERTPAQPPNPRLESKTPLRTAAVGTVLRNPGLIGYKVAQGVNRGMGGTRRIRPKHIYTLMGELEYDGLVVSERTDESREGARYFPAEKAGEAWQLFLMIPLASEPDEARADLVARVAFSSSERDAPLLLRTLEEYRKDRLAEVERAVASATEPMSAWAARVGGCSDDLADKDRQLAIDWAAETTADIKKYLSERR
jgi:DNA-binding PadR family transcriptional regulator